MLHKAPESGADTIVFDLEDAVAPSRKDAARETVREVLSDPEFASDCEVCVRVNASSAAVAADLEALLAHGPIRLDSLLLPKVERPDDVETLTGELERFDSDAADVPVLALIETARGVLAAPDIAGVPETDALVFGAEDLSADIGATRTDDGTEVLYARERVVLAAAANDCSAIDTVFTDFGDEAGLIDETEFAIRLGYDGKLAIHPAQVDPINDAFTPTTEELEWARGVLDAKRDADADGRGVFAVDGQMIDAPLIAQAERIEARAAAASADEDGSSDT
ncbi:Citryl-CoA lyase [Natrialba asiatica DSM 12278]|uniref:Citryl-CoA lyase n=2 Tax=Natrialba asiatica TaxID=64602 RepID=M0ARP1_NATA1|nr:Citryl-CoA lyase [Natrialba asiatica DSM 12278]